MLPACPLLQEKGKAGAFPFLFARTERHSYQPANRIAEGIAGLIMRAMDGPLRLQAA